VRLCKGRLGLDDASPWDLSQELNTTPFGAIKYGFPKKEFARLPLEEGEVR
jgi:hypothetical protein